MSANSSSAPKVKEYSIIVPKDVHKKYHVMRFNSNLGVEFEKWTQVKMERENNSREFKGNIDIDSPKFGAGSEFGREARDEARRKKLGIIAKKYNPEDQPWILKSAGSTVKKFKGIREGGVSENTAYYVFTHAANNVIRAYPLNEWYKFQPIQRYKALSAEEAEQEFSKRNKHLNYFSLMLRKRLKGDEDAVVDGESGAAGDEGKGKGKKTAKKDLTISEMDEWMDSSDDDDDDDDDEDGDNEDEKDSKSKNKKKAKNATSKQQQKKMKKKRKQKDSDEEAFEDSDDGDGEGREQDYITDSSDSEPENAKLEGVAEEKALRKLLNSDDEDDSDSEQEEKDDEKEDEKEEDQQPQQHSDEKTKDALTAKSKKKKANKKDVKKETKELVKKEDNSDFSSDSSTDEEVVKKRTLQQKKKKEKKEPEEKVGGGSSSGEKRNEKEPDSPSSSRSESPIAEAGCKRKIADANVSSGSSASNPTTPAVVKKIKMEPVVNYIPGAAEAGITEDAVRKYLMRKPMTTTELLQKFKSKKTGLSSEQLVNIMTQILKKINPIKQMLKGKMYLSIKSLSN